MSQDAPLVLVVDDDAMIADAMSRGLKLAGYRTVEATDGHAGLRLARSEHPDLIVLDYNMPDYDGLRVLQELRKDAWGHAAKVIFATNVYDVAAVNDVMALGVRDYIMKSDFAMQDFLALVNKYVPLPSRQEPPA